MTAARIHLSRGDGKVDVDDLKSSGRNPVQVRVLPPARQFLESNPGENHSGETGGDA